MSIKLSSQFSLFDNSLSEDVSIQCYLCLEIGISGFAFAVYHKKKNIFLALESFSFGNSRNEIEIIPLLEQISLENKWLNLSFSKTIILINNGCNTLVPNALFSESEKKAYLKFNHAVEDDSSVYHDYLKNAQAVNVYATPTLLTNFIEKKWPKAKMIHYASCVNEALGNQFKNRTNSKTLFINLRDKSFDIIYFKDAKFFFYNNFKYNTKEDFIYFSLVVMEQLSLSPEETKILLAGKITEDSGIFTMLHQYVRHLQFIKRNESYKYSELLSEEICRQYYVLMNVLQCV